MTSSYSKRKEQEKTFFSPKISCQSWKLPQDATLAYTGYQVTCPSNNVVGQVRGAQTAGEYNDEHVLNIPLKKEAIIGYSGHLQNAHSVVGSVVTSTLTGPTKTEKINNSKVTKDFTSMFRSYAKNMDIHERYNSATMKLYERGESPIELLKIVQNKFCERVSSYAEQYKSTKLIFQAFDFNGDGVLDEFEFRECLEKMNVQLDDVRFVALFAYFDTDNTGVIKWEDFLALVSVPNPKGGVLAEPKHRNFTVKKQGAM